MAERLRLRWTELLPALVVLLLTVPFVQHAPLWADEVDSVDAARRTWSELLLLLRHQDAPLGLYYALLHAWTSLVGTSEAAVRAPSIAGTALAAALVARTGRVLGGPRAGLLAGLALASSPFVETYALDARPYALELTCGAALLLVVAGAPANPSPRRRATWAVLLVLGSGLHLFFVLVLPAHLLALRLTQRPLRPWLLPATLAVLVLSPLLLLAGGQTAEVGYLHAPGPLGALGWLQAMTGGQPWLSVPSAVLAVLLLREVRPEGRALSLSVLLVPGALLLGASLIHPLFLRRYVLASAVGAAVLLGVGADASARPRYRQGLAAVLLLSALTTVATQRKAYRYEDLRAGADLVLDHATSQDAIVFAPATVRAAAGYYLNRVDVGAARPIDVAADPARDGEQAGNFGGQQQVPAAARMALLGHRTVWRLSWDEASARRTVEDRGVLDVLRHGYRLAHRTLFGGLLVEEYRQGGQ